jgi:excisionase family DNA binding protein
MSSLSAKIMPNTLLSIPDAARELCCDPKTVRNMIRQKEFPVIGIGKQLRIDAVELKKWLDNGGVKKGAANG